MIERLRPHWRKRIVAAKKRSGRPWRVGELEDHLLVLLLLYRCAITQDFVACLSGTDQSVISRAMRRMENLAARVLGVKHAIRVSSAEAAALIFDGTEQPIQRPGRKQRCGYSGKKKRHTIKTEIVITEPGRIVSVSRPAPGSVHDITIRRRGPQIPKDAHVYVDSGYQGVAARPSPDRTALQEKQKQTANRRRTRLQSRVEPFPRPRRAQNRSDQDFPAIRRTLPLSQNYLCRQVRSRGRHCQHRFWLLITGMPQPRFCRSLHSDFCIGSNVTWRDSRAWYRKSSASCCAGTCDNPKNCITEIAPQKGALIR